MTYCRMMINVSSEFKPYHISIWANLRADSSRLFSYYKNIAAVLYPVLSDVDQFESDMKQLLEGRQRAGGVYEPDSNGMLKPFGMSIGFLSLCFAVLASGCQLSDLPGIQREMTSWIYGEPSVARNRHVHLKVNSS